MFKKYNSIENTYNKKIIEKICNEGYDNEEWIAMEKVHGGNFSVVVSDDSVLYCRRTDVLKDDENFFDYQNAVKKDEKTFVEIYKNMKSKNKKIIQIQFYGEIFGGKYPHPEIEKNKNVKCVQKEISYHPDIKFMIFDIFCKCNNNVDYISHDDVVSICQQHDLLYSPVLYRGTLKELLKLDPLFETTIPDLFNLPKIENNVAEGFVFKPAKNLYLGSTRIILKHKNDKFKEKENPKEEETKICDFFTKSKNTMFLHLNKNRVSSVKSKMTEEEQANKDFVIEKLIEDVFEDMEKEKEEEEEEYNYEKLREIGKKYCLSKKYF